MSYTSDVRSLVYGDGAKVKEFLTKRAPLMLDHRIISDKHISFYKAKVSYLRTKEVHILDLNGMCWKWYACVAAVSDWYEFMYDAEEEGLYYEFLRIGESYDPVDLEFHTSKCSLNLLEFGSSGAFDYIEKIGDDIPLQKLTFSASS